MRRKEEIQLLEGPVLSALLLGLVESDGKAGFVGYLFGAVAWVDEDGGICEWLKVCNINIMHLVPIYNKTHTLICKRHIVLRSAISHFSREDCRESFCSLVILVGFGPQDWQQRLTSYGLLIRQSKWHCCFLPFKGEDKLIALLYQLVQYSKIHAHLFVILYTKNIYNLDVFPYPFERLHRYFLHELAAKYGLCTC